MLSATEPVSRATTPGEFRERLDRAKSLLQKARPAAAVALLQTILDENPGNRTKSETLYMLAVAQRRNGNHADALRTLATLVDTYPGNGRAHQESGHNYLALNELPGAIAAFGKAVELNAGLVASWRALAGLYERSGEEEKARFARTQTDYLDALPRELQGVIDLAGEGKLHKAEQLCRSFLQRNRQHVEGMRLLADIGMRMRNYDDAEFLLESCIEFEPGNVRARSDYLKVLNRKGKFEQALEQAQHLNAAYPDNPAWQVALASALAGLGRHDEAIEGYLACLETGTSPNEAGVYLLLGHAYKATGKLTEAVAAYRNAYRQRADYGDAFWSLANTKTYRFTEAEIAHLTEQESSGHVALDDRVHFCFAAGKAFEDRGEYDRSFGYYRRGNDLQRERSGYDAGNTTEAVQAQIDQCTRALFAPRGTAGYDCRDPIFIVGLPRAGSTLLEQILASHSMVDGTLELHNMLALAQRLGGRAAEDPRRYPAILHELDSSYFRRFGEQYIENTRVYRAGAPLFIDKMPNNFMHIGLIRLVLPGAKIIDARRHPLACCVSGYKQLFGEGQDFTYGLESIGRYYRDYVRLMQHWDDVLPGFVLRVNHEDVVDNLDIQVRRMLDFCGLPFEQGCIDFHKTKRTVRTPSSEQVRQPIYRSGLEQWRHFKPHLGPLEEALGDDVLAPYRNR